MVVTVYQTQTEGWDGLGSLTTLEGDTGPLVVITIQTEESVETGPVTTSASTSQTSSSSSLAPPSASPPTASSTHTSGLVPTSASTPTASSTQLSTASIVGIALGSVTGVVLVLACLLFALGFRIRRAKWKRHNAPPGSPNLRDEHPAAKCATSGPYGKAELADTAYIQKIERLHKGSKPELEGNTALKSVWRLFSTRSSRRSGSRKGPAELAAEPVEPGPYELPGEGALHSSCEQTRDTRGPA